MQKRIYWNDGWKFKETYENQMRETAYQDDAWRMSDCRTLARRHRFIILMRAVTRWCAAIENIFLHREEWKDQTVIVTFEGIAHEAQVFLNGKRIGEHHCGYTAFSIDISKKLRIGGRKCAYSAGG